MLLKSIMTTTLDKTKEAHAEAMAGLEIEKDLEI